MSTKTANHPLGQFEWSAFGAGYEDTICVEGICGDLDQDGSVGGGIPCPFCNPEAFFEYRWGGGYTYPTCGTCEQKLPEGTPITFHDGKGLTWTADCPACGLNQKALMREYEDEDDAETLSQIVNPPTGA